MPASPSRTPFVGRERELTVLLERLTRTGESEGGVVLISGEPGIGKTRLLGELAALARAAGWLVLGGRAYETEGMPPYLPFIEAIKEYLLHCPLAEVRDALGRGAPEVARLVPEIRDYFPEMSDSSPLSPDAERYRLFESTSSFLLNIACVQMGTGLLLLLDDLHWADRPTLLLLLHLSRKLSRTPLLVIGTHRRVDLDATYPLADLLAELSREALGERVQLASFSAEEVRVFLANTIGGPPADAVVNAIYRETEGNPFFVGEVVRHLQADGRDLADPGATVGQWGIPQGVREVIGRRLSRLGADTNRLLRAAAVQGDDLPLPLLAAMTDLEAGVLADALEEAVAAGMLREARNGYQFTHALIRETLYDELSLQRRQHLHLRTAEAIETLYARNLTWHLAGLAGHYRLAGTAADAEKAIAYSMRAAEAAKAIFAWEEEAAQLEATLLLVGEEDLQTRCDLLLSLGEALRAARQPLRVVEEVAPAAFTLAETLGDGVRATRACGIATQALLAYGSGAITGATRFREWAERADRWAAPGTPERVRADVLLLYALSGAARYREGRALIPRLLALVQELPGSAERCEVVAQILALNPAPADEATRLQLAEEYGGGPQQGVTIRSTGWLLFYAGWIHLDWGARGRTEGAWRWLADLATRTHDPGLIFFSLRTDLIVALLNGDLAGAVAASEQLVRRAQEEGSPVLAWFHSSNLVYRPLLHLGRAEEALARAAIPEAARALGLTTVSPPYGAPEALCLAHAGRHPEARRTMREWLVARGMGDPQSGAPTGALVHFLETAVLTEDLEMAALLAERLAGVAFLGLGQLALTCIARHLGDAAALLGDTDQARRYYKQSLDVCARIQFRPELALTRLALAELLLAQLHGERADALGHLDAAIAEFRDMGMQPSLERARRVQAQAAARDSHRHAAPIHPDGLSERELEVLRLIAAGKSNPEIAAALVISRNTVERHVNHILAKTGTANRTEAATYAHRQGLAS